MALPMKPTRPLRGITKDAEALGCDASHLSKCLRGIRRSDRLVKRYNAMKKEQRQKSPTK